MHSSQSFTAMLYAIEKYIDVCGISLGVEAKRSSTQPVAGLDYQGVVPSLKLSPGTVKLSTCLSGAREDGACFRCALLAR